MRTDFHTPCSERSGTKQESAIKHGIEEEGTQQVSAFVPKKIARIGESSEPGTSPSVFSKGSKEIAGI